MNSVAAFFFGVLIVFIIFIPFWLLANVNQTINTAYRNSVCYKVCKFTGTSAIGPKPTATVAAV